MDLLEIIIPLIFAAIYFFGNMFSGKSEDESAPRSAPRRLNEDQEGDAIERQRRIQEEIRRKIMERRREASNTPGSPDSRPAPTGNQPSASYSESPTDRELRQRREAVQRRRAEREQQKRTASAEPSPAESSWERRAPARQSAESEPDSPFSWDSSDNAYESQMQERLQQIEATKRRAEKLKQQAAGMPQKSSIVSPHTTHSSQFARGPVRKSLRDPAAARAAFIYAEVLGQPISQRKQSSVPGLSS